MSTQGNIKSKSFDTSGFQDIQNMDENFESKNVSPKGIDYEAQTLSVIDESGRNEETKDINSLQ